ncbi:MAG: NrdH-redoxin [Chloroflexi bacterium]|jgi:mycoredoxin|nr:glutaredoxin domain-containing protein [Anaerolineaceae bacterium]NMB87035.1 NrdH-redoxin [Chloroflexota bacterium]
MEENKSDIILFYGTTWCFESRRARTLMDSHNIPYQFIDIDKDPEGKQFVEKVNKGMRSVPTILFPDGTILVEPSSTVLSNKLGI